MHQISFVTRRALRRSLSRSPSASAPRDELTDGRTDIGEAGEVGGGGGVGGRRQRREDGVVRAPQRQGKARPTAA